MILLFFLLLLTTYGSAEIVSEVDCVNNVCFVLLYCPESDGKDDAQNPQSYLPEHETDEKFFTLIHESDNNCRRIWMLVEIDTRSANRFDFRVFYDAPVELNITDLVDITTERVTKVFDGGNEDLPLTDGSSPRGGDGLTANLSSFRFLVEVGADKNLFHMIKSTDGSIFTKFPMGSPKKHTPVWLKWSNVFIARCDPSDIVDHCTDATDQEECTKLNITTEHVDTCSRRLWQRNSSDTWLWVDEMECIEGLWWVRRDKSKWNVTSTGLFCGKTQPVCELTTVKKVLFIIFGVYCAIGTILLIALFVMLYHKMDVVKGPSRYKVVRVQGTRVMEGTRVQPQPSSSGGSSGSSSDNEVDLSSSFKKAAKINQRLKQKKNQLDIAKSVDVSNKAKKNQDQKKELGEKDQVSGKSGVTDVDGLKTE